MICNFDNFILNFMSDSSNVVSKIRYISNTNFRELCYRNDILQRQAMDNADELLE